MRVQRVALIVTWLVRRYGLGLMRDLAAVATSVALILLFVHTQAHMPAPSSRSPVICGNPAILGGGPVTPPGGAVTVPAGDDSGVNFSLASTTYWFAPGTHTLGTGAFSQINPGSGSTFTGAPGAVIDGKQTNLYAFVGGSTDVTITYLTIQNFGTWGSDQNEGVVNHDSGVGWVFEYNTIRDNAGAGLFLGSGDSASYNCLKDNQQYGFQVYSAAGPSGVTIDHNEIDHNDTYDWETVQPGCGCTGGGKFWDAYDVTVTSNYVHDNLSTGLWADTDNSGFDFENNYISGNWGPGIIYEISYNALINDNTFVDNAWGSGNAGTGFPSSAVYISESGFDSRAPNAFGYTAMDVTNNSFTDNWGGVVLWENANRYCSSSANTSTGYCTLVNPTVATLTTCANATDLAMTPYIDDCRWKTQNVTVSGNVFNFTPSVIGSGCNPTPGFCGFNGVFSESGTYPPYTGQFVENNITYNQNNVFSGNVYNGPWLYMSHELGSAPLPWPMWQAPPSSQDAGSILNSSPPPPARGGWPGPAQPPVTVPNRAGRR